MDNTIISVVNRSIFTITEAFENFYYRVGQFCGKYPYKVFICTFIVFLVFIVGIFYGSVQTTQDKLWIEQDSPILAQVNFINQYYDASNTRSEIIIATPNTAADT